MTLADENNLLSLPVRCSTMPRQHLIVTLKCVDRSQTGLGKLQTTSLVNQPRTSPSQNSETFSASCLPNRFLSWAVVLEVLVLHSLKLFKSVECMFLILLAIYRRCRICKRSRRQHCLSLTLYLHLVSKLLSKMLNGRPEEHLTSSSSMLVRRSSCQPWISL